MNVCSSACGWCGMCTENGYDERPAVKAPPCECCGNLGLMSLMDVGDAYTAPILCLKSCGYSRKWIGTSQRERETAILAQKTR